MQKHEKGRARRSALTPRPHHYAVPLDRIFYIPNESGGKFPFKDSAIDSFFLEQKLDDANDMLASLGRTTLDREEYILDVDLDYFLTPESLHPTDAVIFQTLLCNAVGITITLPRLPRPRAGCELGQIRNSVRIGGIWPDIGRRATFPYAVRGGVSFASDSSARE